MLDSVEDEVQHSVDKVLLRGLPHHYADTLVAEVLHRRDNIMDQCYLTCVNQQSNENTICASFACSNQFAIIKST